MSQCAFSEHASSNIYSEDCQKNPFKHSSILARHCGNAHAARHSHEAQGKQIRCSLTKHQAFCGNRSIILWYPAPCVFKRMNVRLHAANLRLDPSTRQRFRRFTEAAEEILLGLTPSWCSLSIFFYDAVPDCIVQWH